MDKETYERQKAFAGEKVASMHRRMVGHDYQERQMYMITMATEGRLPLLGKVVGKSDGQKGTADEPRTEPSEMGRRVEQCWHEIAVRYPQIELLAFQLMPDHFHGILFVKERIDRPLGKVLLGFKQGCNKAFRELFGAVASVSSVATSVSSVASSVSSVAVIQQQTEQTERRREQTGQRREPTGRQQTKNDRRHGLLFEPSYNDKLLLQAGQLKRWNDYLRDNPRRLLMKREHPDLFRVQRGLMVGGLSFSAIGNRFLLQRPVLMQVQCSRRLSDAEIQERVDFFMKAAAKGAVLVSPSISPGEKAVMRAAFDRGFPLIVLQENGFTDLAKPGGKRMEACAEGRMLILAPWEHHNERTVIRRDQCLSLNEMARGICAGCCCDTATDGTVG